MSAVKKSAYTASDKQKYTNPIPNRDFILGIISQHTHPLSRQHIAEKLELSSDDDLEALRRRLRAMERDGQVYYERQGFRVMLEKDLISGRVIGHREGFGFMSRDGEGGDLRISKQNMLTLFDGDRIQMRISGTDHKGREQASLVKILERNTKQVVGRLHCDQQHYYVVSENDRIPHEIDINQNQLAGAETGQYVVVTISEYPCHRYNALGEITEVLGDASDADIEIDVIMRGHGIPHEWPNDVTGAASQFGATVAPEHKANRVDLTQVPFVTIDGEDARDFDDALFCETLNNGGWRLRVAIADVSHYVKPNSPLDNEAQSRGTSVYFPGRVVPILPEALSNGLCSLNPNVDRLVMVCDMEISAQGQMQSYQFCEGVIHSHARLTYTQVNALLSKPNSKQGQAMARQHSDIVPHLHTLHELYQALAKARGIRGSIDFDKPETQFQFNQQRKLVGIVPAQRNDAHRLVEECMLCANVATARFLQQLKLPALYRNHKGPQQKKLTTLRTYLNQKGLQLGGGDKPEPKDYDVLMLSLKGRPDAAAIQAMLLRSLSQAEYSEKNQGHFGLAFEEYAHFTSPIRRYPDLLVHRAIRSVIQGQESGGPLRRLFKSITGAGKDPVQRVNSQSAASGEQQAARTDRYPYSTADMHTLGEQCSKLSRRADKAGWDVEAWFKCDYMQDKVGEQFSGTITTVTGFGLFIELEHTGIEGLLHISDLKDDHYQFDESRQQLSGERQRKKYAIGDNIDITIARVDMQRKIIEFIPA